MGKAGRVREARRRIGKCRTMGLKEGKSFKSY
jgi:hypothetical protein